MQNKRSSAALPHGGAAKTEGGTSMDTYEQVRALTAIIANLPETGGWSERDVMETLLDVFEPQELVELGYGDRVEAYLQEYGD